MALSNQAMEEIRNLAINVDGESGIAISKQQTTPKVGHLIISLGGSGADMIREVKGLINQNCGSDNDKHKAPERVQYVAFDTDEHEKEKVSHKKTGQVRMEGDEIVILPDGQLKVMLDQNLMETNKASKPWIYKWLDTNIPPLTGGNGAGGYRQAGRAMLFLNIDKVQSSLDKALTRLITGTGVESLNVYILSGVSGGTGSGTFLDMAYIARKLANEKLGDGVLRPENIRVYGYLIMPDVNLLKANDESRPTILKNAGAALQELDNAMKLPQIKDYYECKYSNTLEIKTDTAPFNYVHLISAKASGKSMPAKPYQHCLDTVAGSILCFVSSQEKIGAAADAGNRAEVEFPVDSFYSNISIQQKNAEAMNPYKERANCYISTGYSCWEIPADRLVKYVFTLMFCKVDGLFNNEPNQNDADRFMKNMGYYCEDLVHTLMGPRKNPLNPGDYSSKTLFGEGGARFDEDLQFDEKFKDIDAKFYTLMRGFGDKLKEELQKNFKDADRGPIWTNHLLVKTFSRIDSLDIRRDEEKDYAMSKLTTARTTCRAKMQEIQKMRENSKAIIGKPKVKEYIDAWNQYYNSYLEAHCYDLLIGNEVALAETGENYQRGFFDEVLNTAAKYNNKWLDVTKQVLEELRSVVQRNTDEFKKTDVVNVGKKGDFIWKKGDIPNLDRAIGKVIEQSGINQEELMQKFLDRLLDKADEWSQSVGVRKFIEEFLEDEAQNVLNASLESLLSSCFDGGNKSLSQSVKEDLMPKMEDEAVPLFDGNNVNKFAGNITIPQGCPQIKTGVEAFIANRPGYNLQTSYLRNRISVISTAVNIALHDYTAYEKCEQQIALDPNAHGLYLNQGEENFRGQINHMRVPLPPVIPTRKRASGQKFPARFKKFEESLVKEFREMRAGRYPFLYFRKTDDLQDYDLDLVLSVDLIHSPFREMIKEENYLNYNHEIDAKKLTQLIAELKDIRYNTGLPEKSIQPKRLIICRNLLNAATQEMKDRYEGLPDEDAEKIKEEVAWEVAEWYYVSAYSFYMKAKEEKAKYDEIGRKIDELEKILELDQQRPVRCAIMAKMLAAKVVRYEEINFCYVYEKNGDVRELVKISSPYLNVKEKLLFEKLESLRAGKPHEQEIYKTLCYQQKEKYDKILKGYYDKAYYEAVEVDINGEKKKRYPESAEYIKKVIEMYEKLAVIRKEALKKYNYIDSYLANELNKDTLTENPDTKEFYNVYSQGIEKEFTASDCSGWFTTLGIIDHKGNLLTKEEIFMSAFENETASASEPEPSKEGWKCPKCGKVGNTGKFCDECGTTKPAAKIKVPTGEWICPKCGKEGNTGKFCPECGGTKPPEPEDSWTCPGCGKEGNTGKFCPECGTTKPAAKIKVPTGEWICPKCGKEGNTGKFCDECGTVRP